MDSETPTCVACGHLFTSTDPADVCPSCHQAVEPQHNAAPDVVDDDDEELIENARAVSPPLGS